MLNELENKILDLLKTRETLSSGDVFELLKKEGLSLVTIKRQMTSLFNAGYLLKTGKGRSVKYVLAKKAITLKPLEVSGYLKLSEQERNGRTGFNFDIFEMLRTEIFSEKELADFRVATEYFQKNKKDGSDTIHKKELERFIIELSWKSSRIEGNTYTLLDTELLLREGLKSNKNTASETQMILNHKKAFDFIFSNQDYFKVLSVRKIEEVHFLLTDDLGIKRNLRKFPVGVTGTSYRPLDNEHQILEAMENMVKFINSLPEEKTFEKSLFTILLTSYIQPFEDGNKRTSRLMGNAVLLAAGLAPLSYRNVDEVGYRGASLIFYEQNSVAAFKKIFVEQYIFACNNYNLG